MPEDLRVRSTSDGDVGILAVGGEVRLEISSALYEAGEALLATDGVRHLLIDLSAVVFMDSASLSALIRLDNRVLEGGGRLVLYGLSTAVKRLLANVGLDARFTVAPDEAAARSLLG